MANQSDYSTELLQTWEETYKKGQLTLWMLLSLRDKPRYVAEIQQFISDVTRETITCEEQSLYRALRKFTKLEIVGFEMREGKSGPDRKYYTLTDLGRNLLEQFIQRNIAILFNAELEELLRIKEGEHVDA
jgi:PadR family transcriptional regulator, regulatory protein PadR